MRSQSWPTPLDMLAAPLNAPRSDSKRRQEVKDTTKAVKERGERYVGANSPRGKGVDERVSDQASAAGGATIGLYHVNQLHLRLHASRGGLDAARFWKTNGSWEGVWKPLKRRRVRTGARAHRRHDGGPCSASELGQGWGCNGRQGGARLMRTGCHAVRRESERRWRRGGVQ